MGWTSQEKRGGGMVIEVLRERWRHATLYALEGGPQQPDGVLEIFRKASPSNKLVFGTHDVYIECVNRHLAYLLRARFVERQTRVVGAVRHHLYTRSRLGIGLIDSTAAVCDYAVEQYPAIVRVTRLARHLDPDAPMPSPDLDDLPWMQAERIRRRGVVICFGVLLEPQWTYQTLVALTGGPAGAAEIAARINADPADRRAVLGVDHIARTAAYRRLRAMAVSGLVAAHTRRGETRWALTEFAEGLLEALRPCARFGAEHDREMTEAVAAGRRSAVAYPRASVE